MGIVCIKTITNSKHKGAMPVPSPELVDMAIANRINNSCNRLTDVIAAITYQGEMYYALRETR